MTLSGAAQYRSGRDGVMSEYADGPSTWHIVVWSPNRLVWPFQSRRKTGSEHSCFGGSGRRGNVNLWQRHPGISLDLKAWQSDLYVINTHLRNPRESHDDHLHR